jgi:hypothetical protein
MLGLHREHRGIGPFGQQVDGIAGREGRQPHADPDMGIGRDRESDRVKTGGRFDEIGPGQAAHELVAAEPDDRVE